MTTTHKGMNINEAEYNQVIQHHYKSMTFDNALDVVDLLLDIYNFETNLNPEPVDKSGSYQTTQTQ